MRKILIYMLFLAGMSGLSACLDDKNNYNYSEINELKGDIEDMKGEYILSYGEEVTITPSFKFSIDKENPDVSYEWRVDGSLLPDETGASCTISFERGGTYELTFTVVDNKSGVRFSKSCKLRVRSPFTRGWVILSDNGGQSVLSFVGASSATHKMAVTDPKDATKKDVIDRDTLVYNLVMRDVTPGLGTNPTGLFLNAGYADEYDKLFEVSDEVGVMQDRWAELNGTTLERSVYTEEEFRGQLPEAGFHPQAAAMTYSAKALLNSDGYIYWAMNSFASDFHSCTYLNFPLGKDQKFTGVYPSYRVNASYAIIPACTEGNELVGLVDERTPLYGGNGDILEESDFSGTICRVKTRNAKDAPFYEGYQLGEWKIKTLMPAANTSNHQDVSYPYWLALLEKNGQYKLLCFQWGLNARNSGRLIYHLNFNEWNLDNLSGYTDMAVFNMKQYAVIANGRDLWYFQYKEGGAATLKHLHTFNSDIKALGANDIKCHYNPTGNPPTSWQPQPNGQLGVALEDGTFSIFEVIEKKDATGVSTTEASINQLFPDPKTPVDNKFGKIVDIIYKYGNVHEFVEFTY